MIARGRGIHRAYAFFQHRFRLATAVSLAIYPTTDRNGPKVAATPTSPVRRSLAAFQNVARPRCANRAASAPRCSACLLAAYLSSGRAAINFSRTVSTRPPLIVPSSSSIESSPVAGTCVRKYLNDRHRQTCFAMSNSILVGPEYSCD